MNILQETTKVVDAKYIEELITDLMMKDNVEATLKSIKKVLNNTFPNAECDDIIIGEPSNNKNDFYGMSVFPKGESLREIASKITEGKSQKELSQVILTTKISYVIEIDYKLLYDKILNFKPNEIVAILLHELGHVLADSDFYNDLMMAYRTAKFKLTKDKSTLVGKKIKSEEIDLAMIYIITAINSTNIINRSDYDKVLRGEQIADQFVIKQGYGEDLVKALDKTSKFFLNKYKKISTDKKIEEDAGVVNMMNNMIDTRRKYVLSLIDNEIKTTPIKAIKKAFSKIKDSIKSTLLHEAVDVYSELSEASNFISKFIGSPLKVSQADIDELTIEKEMMEDWDDKSILVYKIHKRLSQLESAIIKLREKNDKDSNYLISVAKNYTEQLNKLLKDVMKFKQTKQVYGVFVKYPKGYEG